MCKTCNLYYASLHQHCESSSLDGFGKPSDFAKMAKSLGHNATGKTDHGNVLQNYKFYTECKAAGIKPILGCEIYFEPTADKEVFKEQKNRGSFSHLTILAESNEGYKSLNKLVTEANLEENFYYKPLTTWNNLVKNQEGLIILSGCVLSKVGRFLRAGDRTAAEAMVDQFYKEFGDNYYLEVMPPFIFEKNATDEDLEFHKFHKDYNNFIIAQGKRINRPIVMTTDVHFPSKDYWSSYRVMRYMAQDKYPDSHYRYRYMMDADTIVDYWNRYMDCPCEEYLENTGLIVDRTNIQLDFPVAMPHVDWGAPSQDKLKRLAVKGMKERGIFTDEYKDRLLFELDIIFNKGFEDYFLLVHKIIEEAKSKDIGQGFGRGSVCGSLLAYALGVTAVDPVKFDISFERFLHPEKNSMPDVDMDFDSEGQQYLMKYLMDWFEGKSSRICNFIRYRSKNLFNDLMKYYQLDDEQKNEAEGIKRYLENSFKDDEDLPTLEKLLENKDVKWFNDQNKGFIKHFCNLYKQLKAIGKHPSGVALTDKAIFNYDAVIRASSEYVTSHDMGQIDEMNIVKMDLLGLNNVAVVKDILKLTGAKFSYDCLYDKEVYKAFCDKKTTGIFQFDSWSSAKVLQAVLPENIEELMVCNAINRPGPDLEAFVSAKKDGINKDAFWYEYTKDTYGCVIYQDQLLRICRNIAKLSWSYTDQIVKNMSKKVDEKRNKLRPIFVDACVEQGINKKEARAFYDKNTLYGFNKAHTAGYTFFSAFQMWLKIKYPGIFWFAILKNEDKEEHRLKYASCAIREGIMIFPAHINASQDFELITSDEQLGLGEINLLQPGDGAIREGLRAIKGLGPKTTDAIVANRPYPSKEAFLEWAGKNKRACNKASIEKLEEAGALEFNIDKYLDRMVKNNTQLARKFKANK